MQSCGLGLGAWRRLRTVSMGCQTVYGSTMIEEIVSVNRNRNWNRHLNVGGVRNYKVTVVGASGGIGQPLSLLLKQNPLVCELSLIDLKGVKGVGMDLSHICTISQVESFEGEGDGPMIEAMQDSHIVVVPAGMPRKPGMDRAGLLSANGDVAMMVTRAVKKSCPKALLAFITNPINSVVPIACESLKSLGCYDANRVFGVTTLDVVRARTFIGQHLKVNPQKVNLPVIGGHAGITILPLLSQCCPEYNGSPEERKALVHRIQEAGTEVVKAKAGGGSATLSMAYAAAHFVNSLLRGLNGESDVIECAYVASNVTKAAYFSTPLELGPNGVKKNLGLPEMDEMEKEALQKMMKELTQGIDDGVNFALEKVCNPKNSKK